MDKQQIINEVHEYLKLIKEGKGLEEIYDSEYSGSTPKELLDFFSNCIEEQIENPELKQEILDIIWWYRE